MRSVVERNVVMRRMTVCMCLNGRLFNRGDKNRHKFRFKGDMIVARRLFVQMKHKEIHGSERWDDNRSVLILCNKRPLLVIVRSCANTGCFRRNSKYFRRW